MQKHNYILAHHHDDAFRLTDKMNDNWLGSIENMEGDIILDFTSCNLSTVSGCEYAEKKAQKLIDIINYQDTMLSKYQSMDLIPPKERREFLYSSLIDGRTYLLWGYIEDDTDEGEYAYFTVEDSFGKKVLGSLDGYNGIPSASEIIDEIRK